MKKYKISYRGSRIKLEFEAKDKLEALIMFLKSNNEYKSEDETKKLMASGYIVFHRK